jgi:hypothetical protein
MATVDLIYSWISTIEMILLYGWPFILLLFIFILKIKWKNWPVDVVIIEKRGNNLIKTNDRAGRFIDSYTGLICYKLQKAKDTIPVINYDWVMHNVIKNTTIFDRFVNLLRGNIGTLFLFRYGSKQYKPIYIKSNQGRKLIWKEIKNPDGSSRLMQIYEQFDPRHYIGALDFEVIDWDNINFMVQEQRASILRRQKKGEFWKQILMPIALMVIAGLVCIIMIKFSFDYAMAMSKSAPAEQPASKPNIPVINNLLPGG